MAGEFCSVVFDLESETPEPLGTYAGGDEDVILYRTPAGAYRQAPADCVKVIQVDLFPERRLADQTLRSLSRMMRLVSDDDTAGSPDHNRAA